MLALVTHEYLGVSPRHVRVVQLQPSGVFVAAFTSANDRKCRIHFLEWCTSGDAQPNRQYSVSLRGEVTAIALVPHRSALGNSDVDEQLDCILSMKVPVGGCTGELTETAFATCVIRRCTSSPGGGDAWASQQVVYRILECSSAEVKGGSHAADPFSRKTVVERAWTAACHLGGPFAAAACGGVRGLPNAIHLVRLEAGRLAPEATVPLNGVAGLPVRDIQSVRGEPSCVRLLCHNALMQVDLRVRQQAAVVAVWKWAVSDLMTVFASKDATLAAGTEDGCVVLFDIRGAGASHDAAGAHCAVGHSEAYGSAVTGIHMPHSTEIHTCNADGTIWEWSSKTGGSGGVDAFGFVPRIVHLEHTNMLSASACVALAAAGACTIAVDDSGYVSILTAK